MFSRHCRVIASLASLAGVTAFAAPAFAEDSVTTKTNAGGPAERFGAKGQIAVSSDAALTIQSSSQSGVSGSTTTVQLEPAADFFVVDNVSLGGFIGFDYTKTGDVHQTRFSIGPRVGYNYVFSDLLSIWPKVGFSFASTSEGGSTTLTSASGTTTTVDTSASNSAIALNIFVPLMFHPVPHFFAGFGPFLDTDLSGDKKTTTFGGKLTIGGWFDTH